MLEEQVRHEEETRETEFYALASNLHSRLFGRRGSVSSEGEDVAEDPVRAPGSAWRWLYNTRDDRAFIKTMGVDVQTFEDLLVPFSAHWHQAPIPWADAEVPPGQAQMDPQDAAASLGLVLHWLSSTMDEFQLQDIFAISPRAYAQSWTRGRKALLAVLKQLPGAKIYWPTKEKSLREYCMSIERKYPLLKKAFGFSVGFNLPVFVLGEDDMETSFYNQRADKYYYRNILTFAPDGTILGGCYMLPGDWDDDSIAVDCFHKNLLERTPAGYRLISDDGFPNSSEELQSRILAPVQRRIQLPDPPRVSCRIRPFNRQVRSAQHVAKWSKHVILDFFERLREPLCINERELQAEIWQTAARLHQFRWRLAQTRRTQAIYQSVWDGNWLPEVDLDESAICEIEPPCHVRQYYIAQGWR
ncbi:hypothetical protein PTTG_06708 [Puccinia triticina 1-1 BBBD Race 1]|uniref:DDE Tnp4 domain-containing protein n=1 Tax=Puccinia triticina (isolate 1-1 / race 1 (BBBD)) TaxID=630390 RepID=A0A0C4F0T8_PUCT1|nr:hypothetical protein PTTG_06708 [Puccinia triticina 1-1 BBBD Race 1]